MKTVLDSALNSFLSQILTFQSVEWTPIHHFPQILNEPQLQQTQFWAKGQKSPPPQDRNNNIQKAKVKQEESRKKGIISHLCPKINKPNGQKILLSDE